ncbi:MAG: UDP-N-acetylmuramate dehydrogenase [Shewanellaceae bacterium]|nr:UDP-N-acetylmuramate dehydrogenase [Shewanellaceae bacterium]
MEQKTFIHHSLSKLHTFGFNHHATRLYVISRLSALEACIQDGLDAPMVLGSGSNIVFTGDYTGHILKNELKGKQVIETQDAYLVTVASGEIWHDFVVWTLTQGIAGLENLAFIPGTVGAAPVQNIGAYGVDLSQFCKSVTYVDLTSGARSTLDQQACRFGYRDSVFKHDLKNQTFIESVTLKLPKKWRPNLTYGTLKHLVSSSDPWEIYHHVGAIRRQKLPDVTALGNAGSFFKNPIISKSHLKKIQQNFPEIPCYPNDHETCKVAAGWIIEACQFKQKTIGRIQVYDKQALVLVNLGDGCSQDLMQLVRLIQQMAWKKFSIQLDPEVRFYAQQSEWTIHDVCN